MSRETVKRSDLAGHARSANARCSPTLLDHNRHLIRDGQIILVGKGFADKHFNDLTDAMGLRLLRPDRKNETYRNTT